MKQKNPISKYAYLLVSFSFFVFVNAYFSQYIVKKLQTGAEITSYLVNFNYVKNTGAAFSILHDATVFLIILSVAALLIIIFYVFRHVNVLPMKALFAVALLMAGIAGNMCERIYFGYVRDYFELTFVNFPVFNISDVYINIGVFVIILLLLNKKYSEKL